MDIYKILSVAFGGFIGSISRYLASTYASRKAKESFSYGTIAVNIAGSFFLGVLLSLNANLSLNPYLFLFLTSGFAGAFTTFSTAMFEQYKLMEDREKKNAFVYLIYTMWGGILSAYLGYWSASIFK